MKLKLHKLGLGLAASVMLFAALPAHAINKYGCIYAVDPWDLALIHIYLDLNQPTVRMFH